METGRLTVLQNKGLQTGRDSVKGFARVTTKGPGRGSGRGSARESGEVVLAGADGVEESPFEASLKSFQPTPRIVRDDELEEFPLKVKPWKKLISKVFKGKQRSHWSDSDSEGDTSGGEPTSITETASTQEIASLDRTWQSCQAPKYKVIETTLELGKPKKFSSEDYDSIQKSWLKSKTGSSYGKENRTMERSSSGMRKEGRLSSIKQRLALGSNKGRFDLELSAKEYFQSSKFGTNGQKQVPCRDTSDSVGSYEAFTMGL